MNVGIIGSGFIVPVFMENAKKDRHYHLRAIWGRHEEKLEKFKDDVDYCTMDLNVLLNDEKIDVIYVALPNGLHYEYAMKALKHGKHVIMEKPFTVHRSQAKKLIRYAEEKGLIIFEAILTRYEPNYQKMKERKDELGKIRMVSANFSQYSRRYDLFRKGVISPNLDHNLAGGALLDLNIYNIHYVTGMFGRPKKVAYYPNIQKGVDTSGVLILDYGSFKATLVASKDSNADYRVVIQGEEGYLRCDTSSSRCGDFVVKLNKKKERKYSGNNEEFGGWRYELKEFARLYREKDYAKAHEYNEATLLAMWVLDEAMKFAGMDYE